MTLNNQSKTDWPEHFVLVFIMILTFTLGVAAQGNFWHVPLFIFGCACGLLFISLLEHRRSRL